MLDIKLWFKVLKHITNIIINLNKMYHRIINLFTAIKKQNPDETHGSRIAKLSTSMMEDTIKELYFVPGITNDQIRLYVDKAFTYVKFKDGSGTIRLFINSLKIHHVYVFDKRNVCKFGGYVGWIHTNELTNEINNIKNKFE